MVADVSVKGADKLQVLARALREAGDKELKRELYSGLNRSTQPLRSAARQSAFVTLPQHGGLARRVARSRLSTRRRTGLTTAGVSIVAKGMDQLQRMDRGTVRHPVYGNRNAWVTQRIKPGWFTVPMRLGAPKVRRDLVRVLDDVAKKIARKVR